MKINDILKLENELFSFVETKLKRGFIQVESDLRFRALYNGLVEQLLQTSEARDEDALKTDQCFLLIHGYCSGIGMWALNATELGQFDDIPFIAIDFPGFGLSSRPKYSDDVDILEKQLADVVEKLRKHLGVKKLIIAGHSFGAYISSLYAIHYPEHVESLILLDPWGFNVKAKNRKSQSPENKSELEKQSESVDKSITSETQTHLDNLDIIDGLDKEDNNFDNSGFNGSESSAGNEPSSVNTDDSLNESKAPPHLEKLPFLIRFLRPFITRSSPFDFLRLLGPYIGPKLIVRYRSDIFTPYRYIFKEKTEPVMSKYLFGINSLEPTGEAAYFHLAEPFGWAKRPMNGRTHQFPECSIYFINGLNSWINHSVGYKFKELSKKNDVKVTLLENCGHHVYSDQYQEFNHLIKNFVRNLIKAV